MNYQVSQIHNFKDSPVNAQFIADVEFGVPSKNCKNFGICRINPIKDSNSLNKQEKENECEGCKNSKAVKSVISILKNGVVKISFLRFFVTELKQTNHFEKGRFIVEEDFNFSMNEDVHFQIKKGIYAIRLSTAFITVIF